MMEDVENSKGIKINDVREKFGIFFNILNILARQRSRRENSLDITFYNILVRDPMPVDHDLFSKI